MKTYLVEYHSVTTPENPLELLCVESEEAAFDKAYRKSMEKDYLESGSFDMYLLLRNPNGELYLADLDGDAISSSSSFYARRY